MTFAENIERICREKGTTLTALLKSLGLSTSKVTPIKQGQLPKEDLMLKYAEALGCSVMDFFADEEDLATEHKPPMDEDEKELIRIFQALDRRAKHEFMSMVYDFEKRVALEGDRDSTSDSVGKMA